jgi:hypothetical protein
VEKGLEDLRVGEADQAAGAVDRLDPDHDHRPGHPVMDEVVQHVRDPQGDPATRVERDDEWRPDRIRRKAGGEVDVHDGRLLTLGFDRMAGHGAARHVRSAGMPRLRQRPR